MKQFKHGERFAYYAPFIKRWAKSGLTQQAFCDKHGLEFKIFSMYKLKMGYPATKGRSFKSDESPKANGFLKLESPNGHIELIYKGTTLRVKPYQLKEVMEALGLDV